MTQAREVLIYGASGYTGKLVAEYLATRNIPFYMAGRTRSRLETALDVVKQRVGGHVDAQIVTANNTVAELLPLLNGVNIVFDGFLRGRMRR